MKKMLMALVVTAGALSIAGGGVGIALVDSTPTFGEREFVSLEGGGLSKHVNDTITMTCTKNNDTVLRDASTAARRTARTSPSGRPRSGPAARRSAPRSS